MPDAGDSKVVEAASTCWLAALGDYLQRGIGSVEGWLWPTTASMIAQILVDQANASVRGDLCEIGVHHGRLFLILANAAVAEERAVAVDVFDDQDKNLDHSGSGSRDMLERHIASYARADRCEIIQASSLELGATRFVSRRFRFMSIDGGHTAPIVINDLRLAEQTMLAGGVVALDDILNPAWPGVVTGLAGYLAQAGTLRPFALVPNKLLLATDPTAAVAARSLLRQCFPLALSKPGVEFLGGIVDSYVDHAYYNRETNAGLLSELEDLRRERAAWSTAQNQTEAALRAEIELLRSEHRSCAAELAAARLETSRLRASTSWQATAPLRALLTVARRGSAHS